MLLSAVILVLVVGGLIVGQKALAVRGQLLEAVPLASAAQAAMVKGDFDGAATAARTLVEKTESARRETDDALWKFSERVPFVGSNTEAIRVAAEAADDLAQRVISPLSQIDFGSLQPAGGAFDVEAIAAIESTLRDASDTATAVDETLSAVDRSGLLPPVDDAFSDLVPEANSTATALKSYAALASVLPDALGGTEPRNYLMLFQNNAESRSLGGNPASVVLLTVSAGELTISQQASSSDFGTGRASPIVALDTETANLYGDKVGRYIQDMTMIPDFPTVAGLARAWWADAYGDEIDGVLSFDPVALSYLLGATGPVTLPTGEELSQKNAVSFLLNRVYFRYEEPSMQDAVFAGAAASVFEAVKSGAGELGALSSALEKSVDERRLLYWSANSAETALLENTRLAGSLSSDPQNASQMGVYVNDTTGSKMDYYMSLSVDVDRICSPDSERSSVIATLASGVDSAGIDELPEYVTGPFYDGGRVATDLVFYAPPGQSGSEWAVNGVAVSPQYVGNHLGRSVAKISVELAPGESVAVSFTYTGDALSGSPLGVAHTPMVNDVPVNVKERSCSLDQ